MKAYGKMKQLVRALDGSRFLDGRSAVCEEAGSINGKFRALVAAKWRWRRAPIVIWIATDQDEPDKAEALAWAIGHLYLTSLRAENPYILSLAKLGADETPSPETASEDVVERAKRDRNFRAFLVGAHLLLGSVQPELDDLVDLKASLMKRAHVEGFPERIADLWLISRDFDANLSRLIGEPWAWARCISSKRRRAGAALRQTPDLLLSDKDDQDCNDADVDNQELYSFHGTTSSKLTTAR